MLPDTQPPASTIPMPKRRPPSPVCIPSGNTLADGGYTPNEVIGICWLMTSPNPTDATARPSSNPLMLREWPIRKMSRNADAKQKRAR